jgi:UDP-N-acetyl-D-glucosamine/UDP-N-acetyl-D-galactosamine dehydrogenase
LGITFKENCPDVRNTKSVDGISLTTYYPWANEKEVLHEYNLVSVKKLPIDKFDAIVLTVAHNQFLELDLSLKLNKNNVVYDVKYVLDRNTIDGAL